MPTFSGYTDIDVDVDEFYNECTKKNIEELIELLKEDGHIKNHDIQSDDSQPSLSGIEFNEMISKLNNIYLQLSLDDLETLKNIANKY